MNDTKDPLELKLSALRIGWTDDVSGKHTYFSNEVTGKIQIRIGSSAVWIPTATLLKILNDLLADSCIASRAGKDSNAARNADEALKKVNEMSFGDYIPKHGKEKEHDS